MYITENQNYDNSALFLLAARSTLAEMIQASKSKSKADLVEYIYNDASDFEVMGLMMTGKLPPVKYSSLGEKLLFSNLKEQVLKNFGPLSQVIGESSLNSFLTEVDSVFPRMSTQKPVLEFFAAVREEMTPAEKVRKQDMTLSQAHEKEGEVSDQFKGREMGGKPESAYASTPAGSYGHNAPGIFSHLKSMADDAISKGRDVAATIVKYASAHPQAGAGVAAAALASLIAYAGYQVYKRHFSKAAKACAGKEGPAKTQCIAGFKKQATSAQAQTLMKASAACAKSKDPQKCKAAVRAKVEKARSRM